ncbi:hypothetical protein CYY_005705 [Polysphondylium violaceum]|uniref:Nicotinate-nucleotide pyrophosphorylase [carboxylating] n=1 Tax=Polysphondylium violaceum TaxID=133409 RepID=A0A8J4PRI8_9MYCE|nr:hypothetical protein CYY_005705 [Polysphondylium violaceum]
MDPSLLFPPNAIQTLVRQWLDEDIPSFDYGGAVVGNDIKTAHLLGKQRGIFSGAPFFNEIFTQLNCKITWFIKDGQEFNLDSNGKPFVLAHVTGPSRNILVGERLSLNILARASGIATRAKEMRDLVDQVQWKGKVAGTRKTTPGFRLVEKYSLLVGGLDTHRMDLSSMIMLKDNHIWSCGSITNAVHSARSLGGFSLKIEVECQNKQEAIEAIDAGANVVMLDNYTPDRLAQDSKELKQLYPHIIIEASGGITPSTIQQYALPTVDIISMGNLTQGVPHIDISLKIQKQ